MKKRIVLFASVLMLSNLACSFVSQLVEGDAPVAEPLPVIEVEPVQPEPIQPEPTAISEHASNILFEDDFSDTSSGWDRNQDEDGLTDYYNGGYQIQVNSDNLFIFANPGLTNLPNDVRIEVDATKQGGSDDNSFGILCRYQDVSNFYRFIVTSDGYAGILLVKDGSGLSLNGVNLTPINAALAGNVTNKIRVNCIGHTLSLFVNGEQVLTAQDSTFSNGDVGVFAGTFDIVGTDILFDNFVVTRP